MIREELAALRALLSDLVFLTRVPESLRSGIDIHQVCDAAGQRLAFTQARRGKVGNGPADVANRRIQITVRVARQHSDKDYRVSRALFRMAQACSARKRSHPRQR